MNPRLAVFELWQTSPEASGAGLSFAAGAASEAPLWRVDLGPDHAGGRRRLAALEGEVRQAREQLGEVPNRLDQLLLHAASRPQDAVSFSGSPAAGASLPDPERDLLLWAGRSEVSFAAAPTLDLSRARGELEAALKRLSLMLSHMARVETWAQGRLVGRTTVGWSGKTHTVSTADPEQGALHQRNVSLAVTSRLAFLRTLVMVQQAAVKISMLLSSAGGVGAIAALPVAWRYVNRVLVG